MLAVNLLHPAGLPLTVAALLGLLALMPRSVRDRVRFDEIVTRLGGPRLVSFGVLCLAAIMLTALV
jgi:hypothetical protein